MGLCAKVFGQFGNRVGQAHQDHGRLTTINIYAQIMVLCLQRDNRLLLKWQRQTRNKAVGDRCGVDRRCLYCWRSIGFAAVDHMSQRCDRNADQRGKAKIISKPEHTRCGGAKEYGTRTHHD